MLLKEMLQEPCKCFRLVFVANNLQNSLYLIRHFSACSIAVHVYFYSSYFGSPNMSQIEMMNIKMHGATTHCTKMSNKRFTCIIQCVLFSNR